MDNQVNQLKQVIQDNLLSEDIFAHYLAGNLNGKRVSNGLAIKSPFREDHQRSFWFHIGPDGRLQCKDIGLNEIYDEFTLVARVLELDLIGAMQAIVADFQLSDCQKGPGKPRNLANSHNLMQDGRAGTGVSISDGPQNMHQSEIVGERTGPENGETDGLPDQWPGIPEALYGRLPYLLRAAVNLECSKVERDFLFIGLLVVVSGCLPGVQGVYKNRIIHPNLYAFLMAPPASGKGMLSLARRLAMPIHKRFREISEQEIAVWKQEQEQANSPKHGKPGFHAGPKPDRKLLLVPGNSSSAKLIAQLAVNNSLVMMETEADTVNTVFRNDWGSYSDILRKASEHESISLSRRQDDELVEVDRPCLSVCLAGTPNQHEMLFKGADNGLFSRFIHYVSNQIPAWQDVSPSKQAMPPERRMEELGIRLRDYWDALQKSPTEVTLTVDQWTRFNGFFEVRLEQKQVDYSSEISGVVMRLGRITFRIMMIFSALRKASVNGKDPVWPCTDEDFQTALDLAEVFLAHSTKLYIQRFPVRDQSVKGIHKSENEKRWFDSLPSAFTSAEALKGGRMVYGSEGTVYKCLDRWQEKDLVIKVKHGHYAKLG